MQRKIIITFREYRTMRNEDKLNATEEGYLRYLQKHNPIYYERLKSRESKNEEVTKQKTSRNTNKPN